MLDAFIIERIRQQQERESSREPLRVEIPLRPEPEDGAHRDEAPAEEPDRGVVIIDDIL